MSVKKVGAAGLEQELAEEHEDHHHGGDDLQRGAERRGRIPDHVIGEAAERDRLGGELARQPAGDQRQHEEADRGVEQRRSRRCGAALRGSAGSSAPATISPSQGRNDDQLGQRSGSGPRYRSCRRTRRPPPRCRTREPGSVAPAAAMRRHRQEQQRHRDGGQRREILLGVERHVEAAEQIGRHRDDGAAQERRQDTHDSAATVSTPPRACRAGRTCRSAVRSP